MSLLHRSASPSLRAESPPSSSPTTLTPEHPGAALDSDDPSSAADPLLGARDSCELDGMGKTKDDTSIASGEEIEHVEVAPIHHGAAVWESRETYGPAGMFPVDFLLLLGWRGQY